MYHREIYTHHYADHGAESDLALCSASRWNHFLKALSFQCRRSFSLPAFACFEVTTLATIMTQNRQERQLLLFRSTQIARLANRRTAVTVEITVAGGIHHASTSSHVLQKSMLGKKLQWKTTIRKNKQLSSLTNDENGSSMVLQAVNDFSFLKTFPVESSERKFHRCNFCIKYLRVLRLLFHWEKS